MIKYKATGIEMGCNAPFKKTLRVDVELRATPSSPVHGIKTFYYYIETTKEELVEFWDKQNDEVLERFGLVRQ